MEEVRNSNATENKEEQGDTRPASIRKKYPKPLTNKDILLSHGLVAVTQNGTTKQIKVEEAQEMLDSMDDTKASLQEALKGVK